ncbi:MAG: prepilin-type N-terminal cleavage/methylation domain-containing protein, partial [Tepidisphaeraceae bacterium]
MPQPKRRARAGFTLIELLVVIGIITLLISILIPVLSKVRDRAVVASVQAQINGMEASIQAYAMAHGSLPGPIKNSDLGPTSTLTITAVGGGTVTKVTGAENLVLGLMGGLQPTATGVEFNPAIVGRGPRGLKSSNPKANPAYLEGVPLTPPPIPKTPVALPGQFVDEAGDAEDSIVPEIVDRFSEPLPILYLRATKGAPGVISGALDGTIPNPNGPPPTVTPQYDLRQILGYTRCENSSSIGVGKRIKVSDYTTPPGSGIRLHGLQSVDETKKLGKGPAYEYPYDAFPYFQNRAIPPSDTAQPNFSGTPKNKDG